MKLEELIDAVRAQLPDDWKPILDQAPNVHLAMMREPYLRWILNGKKTIESRFSVCRTLPFDRVHPGDAVILKRSSGPVIAVFKVNCVYTSERLATPDPTWIDRFRQWSEQICADEAFWQARRDYKRYVTLIWIDRLQKIGPIEVQKSRGDRRPWIILRSQSVEA